MATLFTKEQIESFSAEERQMFDNLAQRAHASTVDEGNSFDVKSYLARKAAEDADSEAYQRQMDEALQPGHITRAF